MILLCSSLAHLSAVAGQERRPGEMLAASEKGARINQMVRDHEERGVSTFHHNRYQMAHVFEMLVLLHTTDRSTRLYYENLDWGTAEPEELARAFSLLVKMRKSS